MVFATAIWKITTIPKFDVAEDMGFNLAFQFAVDLGFDTLGSRQLDFVSPQLNLYPSFKFFIP